MERKIDYLEYFVRGEKIMGCGFVRTILRDDRVSLHVEVNGLRKDWPWEMKTVPEQDHYFPVELNYKGEWHSAGYMCLTEGAGGFRIEKRLLEVDEDELQHLFRWSKIRIPMDGGREILCAREVEEAELIAAERENPSREAEEAKETEELAEEQPVFLAEPVEQQIKRDIGKVKQKEGTKWEQITEIYPHIAPFEDAREYISIQPEDFLLFSESSYCKADNSFTGHGYHNYGYLILTRVEKCDEVFYYLGVPGNYYPEEVAAAKYFGFDSFDGKQEVTRDGEFGFYLMKVSL